MTRICIAGFYGWRNQGDEGILLAIRDELGLENEYIVCTSLPFTLLDLYRQEIPWAEDVRTLYDQRADYDVYLLGGGRLPFGFAWQQVLQAMAAHRPVLNYGVGYEKDCFYAPVLNSVYSAFLQHFSEIMVRDESSKILLDQLKVPAVLTGCPAINLKEKKFDGALENHVLVCPRYEDTHLSPSTQVDEILGIIEDPADVVLAPFAAYDREGNKRDLAMCEALSKKLPGSRICLTSSPRELKYLISKSKLVISGGRYHALVWAAAHQVPYILTPSAYSRYPKCESFLNMHQKYIMYELKEAEKRNVALFKEVLEES